MTEQEQLLILKACKAIKLQAEIIEMTAPLKANLEEMVKVVEYKLSVIKGIVIKTDQ